MLTSGLAAVPDFTDVASEFAATPGILPLLTSAAAAAAGVAVWLGSFSTGGFSCLCQTQRVDRRWCSNSEGLQLTGWLTLTGAFSIVCYLSQRQTFSRNPIYILKKLI